MYELLKYNAQYSSIYHGLYCLVYNFEFPVGKTLGMKLIYFVPGAVHFPTFPTPEMPATIFLRKSKAQLKDKIFKIIITVDIDFNLNQA